MEDVDICGRGKGEVDGADEYEMVKGWQGMDDNDC